MQAVPPLSYDYPVRGAGNPDDPMDTATVWWQICVLNGVVVGKQHGTMDSQQATLWPTGDEAERWRCSGAGAARPCHKKSASGRPGAPFTRSHRSA